MSKNRRKLTEVLLRSIVFSVFTLSISLLIGKSLDIHILREVDSAKTLQEQYEKDMAGDYNDDYMFDDPYLNMEHDPLLEEDYTLDSAFDYDYELEEEYSTIKGNNTAVYAAGSITLTNDFMTQLEGYYTRASITKLSFLYSATSGFALFGSLQGASIYYNPSNVGEVEVVYSGEIYAPVDSSFFFSKYDGDSILSFDRNDVFPENNLNSIIFVNFNTSNVINMCYTFFCCYNLERIDVSCFDTSNVKEMVAMFTTYSEKLTELDVSAFNTENVLNMNYMFSDCHALLSLDLRNFDTSNCYHMAYMFAWCISMTSLDVTSFNTENVITMDGMFAGLIVTSLDLSNFNTSNVTNFYSIFTQCYALEELNISSFDTSKAKYMSFMFYGCKELTALDVSHFNTSNTLTMQGMFYNCHKLTYLNLTNFDTSKVEYMSGMFYWCEGLTSLDLRNFDTSNVKYMELMFWGCIQLTNLNISSFDTSQVENMYGMFMGLHVIEDLNLSHFNTSKVTDMGYMIGNCFKLTNLNISSFDTSQVANMQCMFQHCWNLTSLNLSHFNTSNVLDMGFMFYNCVSLSNLNLSNFDTTRARFLGAMFAHCVKLSEINISSFNTSNAVGFGHMFYNCQSLISLDLTNFDFKENCEINYMFAGCLNLETVNFNSRGNFNVKHIFSIFESCISLKKVDLSMFDFSGLDILYTNDNGTYYNSNIFINCPSLNTIIAPSALPTDFSINLPSNFCIEGYYSTKLTTFTQPGKTYYRCYDINYTHPDGSILQEGAPTYYVYSQGIKTLPTCEKDGYNFKSWYTEDTLNNSISSISTTQTGDVYLYAKFLYDLQNNISQSSQSTYEYTSNNIYYKIIDKTSSLELNSIQNIKIEYHINNEYTSTIPDDLAVGSYTVRINKDTEDSTYDTITNLIIPNALIITQKDISTCTIYDIEDQVYKGVSIKPTIYILNYNNNKELSLYDATTALGDYIATYENNIIKGEATILLTGVNNYKGSVTVYFNIVGETLENTQDLTMYFELPYYIKTTSGTMLGNLEENVLNGNDKDSLYALWSFVETDDFKYSTILTQGSFVLEVVCTPKDTYLDKYGALLSQVFDSFTSQILIIVENQTPTISNISINDTGLLYKIYDTKPLESISFVYNNKSTTINLPNTLEGITITFTLNGNVISNIPTNAGIYLMKITISANELYDEVSTETYVTINKRTIDPSMIKDIIDQSYTGTQIIPELEISYTLNEETITLTLGIDYTVFGASNLSGEGCAYVIGQGNYTTEGYSNGCTYKYFNISGGDNNIKKDDDTVSISYVYNNNLTYNGKSQVPTFEIYDATDSSNSIKLEESTDYALSIVSNNTTNVQIGISVKIEFKGNYSGYEFKTYNINAYTLSKSNVDSDGNVKANNTTLVENQDYTKVEVESSKRTVTGNTESVNYLYTGINNYDGQFTVTLSEEIDEVKYFKFKDSDTYKFSEVSTGIKLDQVQHSSGNKGETALYLDGLTVGTKVKDIIDLLENSNSQTTTIKVYTTTNSLITSLFYSRGITTNMRFELYDNDDNLLDSFALIIRGDANGDGKINVSDVNSIKEFIKNGSTEIIYKIAGDVNSDGRLTSKDYKLIA